MTYKSKNPFTGEVLQSFELLDKVQLESKLAKAHASFLEWRKTSFEHRAELMIKVAEKLEAGLDEYARLISIEMGKPIKQSKAEVEKCAWVCRHYAENARKILSPQMVGTDASESYIRYDPLGIIFSIMPWNFPFWQVFRFTAPAVMAGNAVVMKHASNVPQCALAIEKLFIEAGFPQGLFSNLFVSHDQVEDIIADDRISGITLTGSEGAGRKVGEMAGKHIKPSVLELGGSDAFIVLEDAELEVAVEKAIQSRTLNNGQSCISAKRFIVHQNIYDDFLKLMKERMEGLKTGDPLDEDTQLGPLARKDLCDELAEQVQKSVELGARVVTGGHPEDKNSSLFPPTILENIPEDSPAYKEEFFGPVAVLLKVNNDEHALAIANDHKYGLGAAIFTRNIEKAKQLAAFLEAGNVFINELVKSDPRLPFGGVKKSGYGRELSIYGIKEFVNIKTVYCA